MKVNKLLVLSLLASTLLVGCDKDTFIKDGDKPVVDTLTGTDKDGNKTDLTVSLDLQKLYENLKASAGGSKALEILLEKIAYEEYLGNSERNISKGFAPEAGKKFDVRSYHTDKTFKADIAEKFENVIDGTSYLDDDGKFDKEAYKEYIEETLDYEVKDVTEASKYLSTELQAKLGYNYDAYIEEDIIPSLLQGYIYLDYVTSSSKYVSYFKSQYSMKIDVLKIAHDTTKINASWNEALVRDVKAVTGNTHKDGYKFGDYSFVTFNSDNEMVLFKTTETGLTYSVYANSGEDTDSVQKLINKMFVTDSNNPTNIKQVTVAEAEAVANSLTPVETFTIDSTTIANEEYYKNIEKILIARKLWQIDREVVLAKNYDYKTPLYNAWTETEKTEAKGFADTYSSSNAKPMKQVAKEKKITAQQQEYYTESDYYTKGNYTSVLPSALTSLRGTNAQTLQNNLKSFGNEEYQYLLPNKDSITDPVYLDTASSNYYICQVDTWYGLYLDGSKYADGVKNVSKSDYQIDAYQAGSFINYSYNATDKKFDEEQVAFTATSEDRFADIVNLVQVSADSILTDTIKKEAIVALFDKYNVEINDQEIHDYIAEQYPDYFKEED